MHGNVAEWVADGYGPYVGTAVSDPVAPGAEKYVIRGGGFISSGESCRSSDRDKAVSSAKFTYVGFRIARKVPEKK